LSKIIPQSALEKLKKNELEKLINDYAKEYFTLMDQEDSYDEKIKLKTCLFNSVFIYCRDHKENLQKHIPKADVISSLDKKKNFFFSVELWEWFNNTINNFDVSRYTKFTNLLNAGLKIYMPKPRLINIYNKDKTPLNISEKDINMIYRINTKSQNLMALGEIHKDYLLWTQTDIKIISDYCDCSVKDVKLYIDYNYKSKLIRESNNYDNEDETNYPWDEIVRNEIEKNDITKVIDKICSVFSNEKEQRKPYISKILTYHFITDIGVNDIDYPFIDKEYAKKLDDIFIRTQKYPTLEEFGEEYGDSNPGQTLKRFFEKVRR